METGTKSEPRISRPGAIYLQKLLYYVDTAWLTWDLGYWYTLKTVQAARPRKSSRPQVCLFGSFAKSPNSICYTNSYYLPFIQYDSHYCTCRLRLQIDV